MKVILNEFVHNLGEAGDMVNVASGYARNFLIPRKVAFLATKENQKTFENNMKQRARKLAKMRDEAEALKTRLEEAGALEFIRKSGEQGKLFGSVTTADICDALASRGFEIDKRKVALATPIKSVGEAQAFVKLHPKVTATVKVNVKAEEPPAPAAEALPIPAPEGAEQASAAEDGGGQEGGQAPAQE